MLDLVPDDYVAPLAGIQRFRLDPASLPESRVQMVAMFETLFPEKGDYAVVDAKGGDGGTVTVRLFEPPIRPRAPVPALLYLHSGGFVLGSAAMMDGYCAHLARELGVVVANVDYRLAPEAAFPGPIEDCLAALEWLHAEAEVLGIDAGRIGVMGDSGGGGLAAALCLLARDRGGLPVKAQLLLYPMLDCRTGAEPAQNPSVGEFTWSREMNAIGWAAMRGDAPIDPTRIGHFSPSLATDLSRLPDTWIGVGSIDLFVDECLDYAMRLMRARVRVDLRTYGGGFHGFDRLPGRLSSEFEQDLFVAIRRLLDSSPAAAPPG